MSTIQAYQKQAGSGALVPWRTVTLACVIVLGGILTPAVADGGPVGKTVAKAAAKGVYRSLGKRWARLARRDLVRDLRTPVTRLRRPRPVFRYVTPKRARLERKRGFAPGTHFTSRATRGRPLTAANAQRRVGVPTRRTRRLTVDLPKGTQVRFNKILAGTPGRGEITAVNRIDAVAIRKVVKLPLGRSSAR